MQCCCYDDHESFNSGRDNTTDMPVTNEHHEEKKAGVTQLIREKLNFQDDRLWKRFSARRLELIDAMDLSFKKASEQEEEIRKVAEILLSEFLYDQSYYSDFDKLVRAAVQSVRRNRKRGSKTNRSVKRHHPSNQEHREDKAIERETHLEEETGSKPSSFLSEIALLSTDAQESVYDLSYSTATVVTHKDQSRNAIDSIIKPAKNVANSIPKSSLSSALKLQTDQRQVENEKKLRNVQASLLQLIKRSRLCLLVALRPSNDHMCELGRSAFNAATALTFESSFLDLNQTSIEYLQVKVAQKDFLADFYRALEQDSASDSLNDETASTSLQILIGCCIFDFGFDNVVYQIGEAIYYLILVEYPLVLKSSTQFSSRPILYKKESDRKIAQCFNTGNSLSSLAAIASEMQSFEPGTIVNSGFLKHGANLDLHITDSSPGVAICEERKSVTIRFLSTSFNFSYPSRSSAPPRYVELMDNAKQAFKLNDNQLFGLRNMKTGAIILSDFELEKIFYNDAFVDIEIYSQGFQAIPIYELTSTITPSEEKKRIILPPPVKLASSSVVTASIKRPISVHQTPNQPKFQPLL